MLQSLSAISTQRLTPHVRLGDSVAHAIRAALLRRADLTPNDPAPPSTRTRTEEEETRALDAAMDRFARGEDAAYGDVYRLAAARVRRFLLRMSGDPALSDDLTQDTFLRAHAARGGFELGASARPWLLAIARNTFLDSLRRAKVRRDAAAATRAEQGAEPRLAPPEAQGDEALAGRELMEKVRVTLDALSPLVREAFVLVRFEGLSMSEAAEVLGTTEAAVKVRAFRAYEALRETLGDDLRDSRERSGRS